MKKLGIYEYRTKLLGRPMNLMEAQKLYNGSVLQITTALAKNCGAWDDPEYAKGQKWSIEQCLCNPVFSRHIKPYWENLLTLRST